MADLSQYDDIFQAAGNEWNVDPTLLKAVASVESSGRTNAVSSKNAQGLMQIIPETQKYLGVTDPTDPVQSIYGAAKYLNEGLDKEGTPEGALLYYHGGPGWRQAYGPESRAYVPAVTAQYVALKPQQPDEQQTAQPAAAPQGPVILGDSLASPQGLGGTGQKGAQPNAIRAAIGHGNQSNAYQGRDVVLSSGASNAPGDMTNVEGQLQNLKDGNAGSVTLLGVGSGIESKNPGTNAALQALADKYGARFQPLPADQMGPDGVHPTGKGYRTLLAAVTPKTATDATPGSAPAPAAPQGQGKAMASDDLPSWLPPAPSAGGAAAPAASATSDGLPSWLPPAPKASTAAADTTQPTTAEGVPTTKEEAAGGVWMPPSYGDPNKIGVRSALEPAPDTVYGDVLPLAMDTKTGQMRFAMPNMLRNPLLGMTGGVGNAITIDPNTGNLGLTPEAASTAQFAATPLRFGSSPGITPGLIDTTRAPDLGPNLLSPDFAARQAARMATESVVPPGDWRPVQPGEVFAPGRSFRMNQTTGQSEVFEPGQPTPKTAAPSTAVPPRYTEPDKPPATTAPPPTEPPKTSAEAKQIASAYYDIADKSGGTLTPQFTNKFVDSVEAAAPQTEAGRAVTGDSAVTTLAKRLQTLRDKPLSLQGAQEVDEGLSNLISKEYGVNGLSKDGQQLLDVQSALRDQIEKAGPGDIQGGSEGFDALVQGRKAWSQARKMDDLERIQDRADNTDNPATSIKSQVRTLLDNRKRSRGYDDDEKAALEDAASRGVLGSALHVFGSRLIPIAAGTAGAATGPLHAFGAAVGAHAATAFLRNMATSLQARRLNRALGTVAGSVPPNPLQPPPP